MLFILQAALQVTGLIWAQPVADVLSTLMAAVLCGKEIRKIKVNTAKSQGGVFLPGN
jgi:hypothetical protein